MNFKEHTLDLVLGVGIVSGVACGAMKGFALAQGHATPYLDGAAMAAPAVAGTLAYATSDEGGPFFSGGKSMGALIAGGGTAIFEGLSFVGGYALTYCAGRMM